MTEYPEAEAAEHGTGENEVQDEDVAKWEWKAAALVLAPSDDSDSAYDRVDVQEDGEDAAYE